MDGDQAQHGLVAADRALAGLESERADLQVRARATADRAEAARLGRRAEALRGGIEAARARAARLRSGLARRRLGARRTGPPARDDDPAPWA
jgi:hypothetical protein